MPRQQSVTTQINAVTFTGDSPLAAVGLFSNNTRSGFKGDIRCLQSRKRAS